MSSTLTSRKEVAPQDQNALLTEEETAETVEDTKENADLKAVRTAEKDVPAIVQYVANALAVNALKDASVLATTGLILIEEVVADSTGTITAAGVAQVEAPEPAHVLQADTANQKQAAAILKGDLAALEKAAEVSSRKLTLETKE